MAAFEATLRALASGEITPDEALTIARMLDGGGRVFKAWGWERSRRENAESSAVYWRDYKDEDDEDD